MIIMYPDTKVQIGQNETKNKTTITIVSNQLMYCLLERHIIKDLSKSYIVEDDKTIFTVRMLRPGEH